MIYSTDQDLQVAEVELHYLAIVRLSVILRTLLPDTEMYRLLRDESPGALRRAMSITRKTQYPQRIVDEITSVTVFIMGELFNVGVFHYDLD